MAGKTVAAGLLLSMAILGALFTPFDARAQPQCDARGEVLRVMAENYGETPAALGVTNNGGLVEVLTTADGSTWSIIVTTPQGLSCLVAAGEGWRAVPATPREDGDRN